MTAQFHSIERAFFDLSERVKLRVTGNDRLRFLNGQLTNDVRKASDSAAIEACVLTAKGRMDAHVFLSLEADWFVLDADPALQALLQPRLERYIIADDVQVEEVSDRFSIFHVSQPGVPQLPKNCRVLSVNRFGKPGCDVWVDRAEHDRLFDQLAVDLAFCDSDCAEVYRIERGIPRWGRELTGEIIPVEANLEERTIDYEKGCYIGQETISRMKMSGQTNKKLCGLVSLDDSPLEPGMRLASLAPERKEVGWITSATHSARLAEQIALGYVKRGFNSTGSRHDAVNPQQPVAAVKVEIVDLPFERVTDL